jgi:hypothetical protein
MKPIAGPLTRQPICVSGEQLVFVPRSVNGFQDPPKVGVMGLLAAPVGHVGLEPCGPFGRFSNSSN